MHLASQTQRSSPLFGKESGIFSAFLRYGKGSAEELVIADDEEKPHGAADGNESRPVGENLLGLGHLDVAANIGQPEGDDQEDVHGPIHVVKVGPADGQHGNGEDGDADEEVVLSHGFFR